MIIHEFLCLSQHWLCRYSKAEELWHWTPERRDRCREKEHSGAFGVPHTPSSVSTHRPSRTSLSPASGLFTHWMLWVLTNHNYACLAAAPMCNVSLFCILFSSYTIVIFTYISACSTALCTGASCSGVYQSYFLFNRGRRGTTSWWDQLSTHLQSFLYGERIRYCSRPTLMHNTWKVVLLNFLFFKESVKKYISIFTKIIK